MKTTHHIYTADSRNMAGIDNDSIDLVVTSPPYPMIAMWDSCFTGCNPDIQALLDNNDGMAAFEAMHGVLDDVWAELWRVMKTGAIACINMGDAARSMDGEFALYPNHARTMTALMAAGFTPLPDILWRKPTNAPNKFMGSGMLPAGAYVTLEHEYILIIRKGGKRRVSGSQSAVRRESAFFWEERNQWFSDVWFGITGTRQDGLPKDVRSRSGAYPFELPYRLIQMYSMYGDTILDPFAGTGTTTTAAMASARNSIGVEIDPGLSEMVSDRINRLKNRTSMILRKRLDDHHAFIKARLSENKNVKHIHKHDGYPVMTRQETEIKFFGIDQVNQTTPGCFDIMHSPVDPTWSESATLSPQCGNETACDVSEMKKQLSLFGDF